MKKIFVMLTLSCCITAHAQYRFTTTLRTSTSNEFMQLGTFVLEGIADAAIDDIGSSGDKFMFSPQLIFPFSMRNDAPSGFGEMKGGYARAFSAPWKHLGDYGISLCGAWDHYDKPFGFYLGLGYNSREVVFEETDLNDRVHYFSPEAGLRFKFGSQQGLYLEMGTSYDFAFSYKGKMHDYGKDAVNSGFCLNLGVGHWTSKGHFQVNFKMPLYNIYNKDFTPDNGVTFPFNDVDRSIGYLSLVWNFIYFE